MNRCQHDRSEPPKVTFSRRGNQRIGRERSDRRHNSIREAPIRTMSSTVLRAAVWAGLLWEGVAGGAHAVGGADEVGDGFGLDLEDPAVDVPRDGSGAGGGGAGRGPVRGSRS